MRIDGNGKCGLISRLTFFLTCRFFPNGMVSTPRRGASSISGAFASPRGTSIVIALGLIAAITFFTIGIATTMISAIQNTASSKKALQAEYAAQGGVEMARKELKGLGVAYGGSDIKDVVVIDKVCNSDSPGGNCEIAKDGSTTGVDTDQSIYSSYKLSYKDPSVNSVRIIPFRGYGNAGNDCSMRKNDPAFINDADPCNWNKIYYGESVEIPLYLIKNLASPDTAKNFKDLGINRFYIKVRPPCVSGYAVNCQRYSADVDGSVFTYGNSIVNWRISGTCDDEACEIGPVMDNSAVQEGRLNPGFSVDFSTMNGQDSFDVYKGIIINFLKGLDPWADNNLNKPVLKLSFVKEVKTADGSSIPYLEYQISYTTSDDSLAAMYSTEITGIGYGFKYSMSGVSGLGAGMFDFAVQN